MPPSSSPGQVKKLPMSDVVVTLCGVHGDEKSALSHALQVMGADTPEGFVKRDSPAFLAKQTTHLISNKSEDDADPKIVKAKQLQIPIVTPAWVLECYAHFKLVDVKPFLVFKNQVQKSDSKVSPKPSAVSNTVLEKQGVKADSKAPPKPSPDKQVVKAGSTVVPPKPKAVINTAPEKQVMKSGSEVVPPKTMPVINTLPENEEYDFLASKIKAVYCKKCNTMNELKRHLCRLEEHQLAVLVGFGHFRW